MMVEHQVEVRMWRTSARFRRVISPEYWLSDFPWQAGAVNATSLKGISVPGLQGIFPSPVHVPHSSKLQAGISGTYDSLLAEASGSYDSTQPVLTWTRPIASGALLYGPLFGSESSRSLGVNVIPETFGDGDANAVEFKTDIECHSASVQIAFRPQPKVVLADGDLGGTSSATEPGEAWAGCVVGSGGDRSYWRLRTRQNGDFLIESMTQDDSEWITKESVPAGSSTNPFTDLWADGQSEPSLEVEFRLLGGRMSVKLVGIDFGYTYEEARQDENGDPITTITGLRVGAEKFASFSFWAAPTRWETAIEFAAPEINIGFSSDQYDDGNVDVVPGSAEGWTVAVGPQDDDDTWLVGPIVRYKVRAEGPADGSWKGQDYSNLCYGIRAVNLHWNVAEAFQPDTYLVLEPEHVQVSHRWNADQLTIESSAEITLNNNRGEWGAWSDANGQVAIEIWAARSTADGGIASQLIFTGYGHVRGRVVMYEGESHFVMSCEGRARQLGHPRYYLPWTDGWNSFYAMKYFAGLRGVSASDLAFYDLVPSQPFGEGTDLGDGLGGPAYYLPVGPGGSVISRAPGENIDRRMLRIGASIGYMLFFDVAGKLQFRKFQIPEGVKRWFYESDAQSAIYQPGGGLEGCWHLGSEKSMDDVRNRVSLIGIDSFGSKWQPIVRHFEDTASIEDPNAFNHLGYEADALWMDSQFAQSEFADEAGTAMARFLRLPGATVNLQTWLQPDLFPLDVIGLQSDRVGISGQRRMIVGVVHDIPKGLASTSIQACLCPE